MNDLDYIKVLGRTHIHPSFNIVLNDKKGKATFQSPAKTTIEVDVIEHDTGIHPFIGIIPKIQSDIFLPHKTIRSIWENFRSS